MKPWTPLSGALALAGVVLTAGGSRADEGIEPAGPASEEEAVDAGEVGGLLGIFWPRGDEPVDAAPEAGGAPAEPEGEVSETTAAPLAGPEPAAPAPDAPDATEAFPAGPTRDRPDAAEASPVESIPDTADESPPGPEEEETGRPGEVRPSRRGSGALPGAAPREPAVEGPSRETAPAVPVLGAEPDVTPGSPGLVEDAAPRIPTDPPQSTSPAAVLPDEDERGDRASPGKVTVRPTSVPTPDLDADLRASRQPAPLAPADPDAIQLPTEEIYGEIEKPDIFFLLPKARSKSDEQLIRSRIRREITRPLIKDWLEEELLLK